MRPKIALVAFGGNAMLPEDQKGLQERADARTPQRAAELMVHIVRKGYELIIVHGNGPQVGNLLIQMEEAANKIPPYTLDVCDAMTEGSMGFMLERALINELRRRSIDKEVASLVTQVVVDRDDPAFAKPTKPVGPFYSKFRGEQLAREKSWTMVEDAGRGYRKVVALAQADRRRPQGRHPRARRGRPHRHRRRRRGHPGHHQRQRPLRGRRGRHRQGLRREPASPARSRSTCSSS